MIADGADGGGLQELITWATKAAGLTEPHTSFLPADAGHRRYVRIQQDQISRIAVLDSDERSLDRWVHYARIFEQAGVRVPRVLACDHERGFLLLTDLGAQLRDALQTEIVALDDVREKIVVLAVDMHAISSRDRVDRAQIARETYATLRFTLETYLPIYGVSLEGKLARDCRSYFDRLAWDVSQCEIALIHGDFHSRNILIDESGRIGVVDFQDAHVGARAIDVVGVGADHNFRRPLAELWAMVTAYRAVREPGGPRLQEREACTCFLFWHLRLLGRLCYLYGRERRGVYIEEMANSRYYLTEMAESGLLERDAGMLVRSIARMGERTERPGFDPRSA